MAQALGAVQTLLKIAERHPEALLQVAACRDLDYSVCQGQCGGG